MLTDKGASAASASEPASKTSTTRQSASRKRHWHGMGDTDSGIYHKPGTHWLERQKRASNMTEADAIKAGYHAAKKE